MTRARMRDLVPWIRLTKAGVRPLRLHTLLQTLGSPEAIFAASAGQLASASGMGASAAERLLAQAADDCKADLAAMERLGVELIPWGDERYPSLLGEIADPPCALYVRGTLEPHDRCAVAVVGTRRASSYGREVARDLSRRLAAEGVTIVSGLARGIDTRAHQGTLAAGGRTLAVLGCGVDVVYPAENAQLAADIAGAGALVSEYPMGSGPEAWRFPGRNRIVSGLSLGTLLVEADERSGALITVGFALEQGREVFAVPGDIRSSGAKGPHRCIQEGAKLVTGVEDILSELGLVASPARAPQLALSELDLTDPETRVLNVLSLQQQHVDDVIAASGLPPAQVASSLLMLELKGLARKLAGNAFVRVHQTGTG